MKFCDYFGGCFLAIVTACMVAMPAAAQAVPHVGYVPAESHPAIPAGMMLVCSKIPSAPSPSKTCPVIHYLGNTTWIYSYSDNRMAMAFVTYDAGGNVVVTVNKNGARYVWEATSGESTQTVIASGQGGQTVTIGWGELAPPPQVVTVPSNSNPPVPAGLKMTCTPNGNTGAPSPTCPVVKYRGITTWAYSFIDNRVSFALVSYDASGNVVRNVTMNGARYVWQITVNPANLTVTVTGQSNASVTAPWSQFGPQ